AAAGVKDSSASAAATAAFRGPAAVATWGEGVMQRSIGPTVTEPHSRAAPQVRWQERWRCRPRDPRADRGDTARHRGDRLQIHDHRRDGRSRSRLRDGRLRSRWRDGRLCSRSAGMVTAGIVHRYRISKLSVGCKCVIDVEFGAVALDTPRELTREVIDADKSPRRVAWLALEYDLPCRVQTRNWRIERKRVRIGERYLDRDVWHLTSLHDV